MSLKRYGSQKERELLKLIESKGGVAFRVAGSGSYGGKPDVVARIGKKYYVIEVKYTTKDKLYLDMEQIKDLIEQAEKFKAVPIVAIKFKGKKKWIFIDAREVPKKIEREGEYKEINLFKG